MKQIELLMQVGAQFTILASAFETAHVGQKGLRVTAIEGGRSRFLTFSAITNLLSSDQIEITYTPQIGSSLSRAGLTENQTAAVNLKLGYVHAVTQSTDRIGSQKQIAKIIKQHAVDTNDAKPPATSTVAGWVKRWIDNGSNDAALMPRLKPSRAPFDENSDLDAIIMAAIKKVYLNKNRRSVNAVHTEIACLLADYNCHVETPLKLPSQETIRKRIQKIDRYQIDVTRHGKSYANRVHRAAGVSFYASDPLEMVMADGQVMDLIVVEENEDGSPGEDIGRPYVTVILDVHSRCVLSAYASLAPFCGGTLLKALSEACVEDNDRPRGIPHKLIIDNGSDYQDSGFLRICNQLGIIIEPCPPRMPNGKANVERFFRTLNTQLIHGFEGTTFSNPQDRGDYDSQAMARLTLRELRLHLDTWIEEIYHTNIHRSLQRTPIDVWAEASKNHPIRTLSTEEAEVLIRNIETRIVSNGRVQLHGLHWYSHTLRSWEIQERAKGRIPTVEVRIDELDLSHVYVCVPDADNTIVKAFSSQPQYTQFLSLYEHKLVKEHIRLKGITERTERMQDIKMAQLRMAYKASLGYADSRIAAKRRDRLREASAILSTPKKIKPPEKQPAQAPILPVTKRPENNTEKATNPKKDETTMTKIPTEINIGLNNNQKTYFPHRSIKRTPR